MKFKRKINNQRKKIKFNKNKSKIINFNKMNLWRSSKICFKIQFKIKI